MWGYINRILGQPSLIRESSMAKFPWSGVANKVVNYSTAAKAPLSDVVLHPSLQKRIEQLARATSNTKTNLAPFRNMLFYGRPGTGKTLVAKEIARKSVMIFTSSIYFISFQTRNMLISHYSLIHTSDPDNG